MHTHAHPHAHTCTYTHAHAHAHTHVHRHSHAHTCVILHLPTIVNHYDNSNVQQKEEGLLSSTHLFILTKRLRLTITSTSLTINILIPVYLHENVTFPHSSDQVSPPVRLGLKQCFQGLLMSCMTTCCLVTPSSSEDDPVAGLLLLLALVGQNLLGRASQ